MEITVNEQLIVVIIFYLIIIPLSILGAKIGMWLAYWMEKRR